ncbi:MAG: amidohydrolase [Chitinophagaceae bacterium]|nr:amidohydrolase [Chitinophagaceae bacterium]
MHQNKIMKRFSIFILAVFSQLYGKTQPGDLKLVDWHPKSMLIVAETRVLKPRFPVIDMHNHLGHLQNAEKYLEEMDKAGVVACVSLDGRSAKDFYKEHLRVSQKISKERFIVFFRPDWTKIDEPDYGRKEAKKLEEAVKMGARGVKVAKDLGLMAKDKNGKLIPVDDSRLDPIWAKCGELGIPVLMHVTDPKAFFTPTDQFNERYEKLSVHPDWSFYGDQFPSKEEILEQRNRVMRRHPNTIFIGAHMGCLPEDLGTVSLWLEQFPNFYIEISARIGELGRQPYTARKFMIKHQDRILFGTDSYPDAEAYRLHYRFLETSDEYIDRSAGSKNHHERWMMYGLYLPDEVLEKIYNKNALKILAMYKGER